MDNLPKTAADLIAQAEANGWKTLVVPAKDTAGNPYVTVEVGRLDPNPERRWLYRLTWHTRGTGTYRLTGKLARTPKARGWRDGPGLRTIRAAIDANPA